MKAAAPKPLGRRQASAVAQSGSLGYRTLVASEADAARALVDQGPGTKVLYTSDHTDEIVHEGHLDSGLALLGKPYRKSDLSQKIREVLAAK